MDEVHISTFLDIIQVEGCRLVQTIAVDDETIHKVISKSKESYS